MAGWGLASNPNKRGSPRRLANTEVPELVCIAKDHSLQSHGDSQLGGWRGNREAL